MDEVGSELREFQACAWDDCVRIMLIHMWRRIYIWLFTRYRGQAVYGNNVEDIEKIMADAPMLQQKMKQRHLTMIAVGEWHVPFTCSIARGLNLFPCPGGSIGTGLFVGSGSALGIGGPAAILIAWIIIGVMLINVTQVSLSETVGSCSFFDVTVGNWWNFYSVPGFWWILYLGCSFPRSFFRFRHGMELFPSMGYCIAARDNGRGHDGAILVTSGESPLRSLDNYILDCYQWVFGPPVYFVFPIDMPILVLVCVFGTLGYAEEEFWSSCLKLAVVVIFIFIGMWVAILSHLIARFDRFISVCISGGGPDTGSFSNYVGGARWSDPGAFANGFKGICAVFVTGASLLVLNEICAQKCIFQLHSLSVSTFRILAKS